MLPKSSSAGLTTFVPDSTKIYYFSIGNSYSLGRTSDQATLQCKVPLTLDHRVRLYWFQSWNLSLRYFVKAPSLIEVEIATSGESVFTMMRISTRGLAMPNDSALWAQSFERVKTNGSPQNAWEAHLLYIKRLSDSVTVSWDPERESVEIVATHVQEGFAGDLDPFHYFEIERHAELNAVNESLLPLAEEMTETSESISADVVFSGGPNVNEGENSNVTFKNDRVDEESNFNASVDSALLATGNEAEVSVINQIQGEIQSAKGRELLEGLAAKLLSERAQLKELMNKTEKEKKTFLLQALNKEQTLVRENQELQQQLKHKAALIRMATKKNAELNVRLNTITETAGEQKAKIQQSAEVISSSVKIPLEVIELREKLEKSHRHLAQAAKTTSVLHRDLEETRSKLEESEKAKKKQGLDITKLTNLLQNLQGKNGKAA